VILRSHSPDVLASGADKALADVAQAVHEVSRLLVSRLAADGISIFQSNGAASGQDVFHLHLHLVPRHHGDGRLTVWSRDAAEQARLDDTHQILTLPSAARGRPSAERRRTGGPG
jgi:histidine triad (HIT) family protein